MPVAFYAAWLSRSFTLSTTCHAVASEGGSAISNQQSAIQLLLHHFGLPIDYLAGETVDGDVHPVMLFAFDDEIVLETRSI